MARLELRWRFHREHYLDFVIDGRSLNEIIAEQKRDDSLWILTENIGCLGWGSNSEYQRRLCEELLGDRPDQYRETLLAWPIKPRDAQLKK